MIEQTPIAFLQPARPGAQKPPLQPPHKIIVGKKPAPQAFLEVQEAPGDPSKGQRASRNAGTRPQPGPQIVGRDPFEEKVEEEQAHDEAFGMHARPKENSSAALLSGGNRCNGRPIGRYFAVCVTDILILTSCAIFFHAGMRFCQSTGSTYGDCASSGKPTNNYAFVCYVVAGVCELVSLICALIANFRKNRTFIPFSGSIIALVGTVAGFCAGVLGDDLGNAAPVILISFVAFCGFFTLGMIVHGGMSLRQPPPAGSAYSHS